MKILFVSSEAVPFAKTGGLADVAGALPKALKHVGHDVRLILPLYKKVDQTKWKLQLVRDGLTVDLDGKKETVAIYQAAMPGSDLIVYFVQAQYFLKRDELYGVGSNDYPDNCEAFLTFCRGILAWLQGETWRPDVIHCNDWQSAPLVAMIHNLRRSNPAWQRVATVYSVHNMVYQGLFPAEKFPLFDLPAEYFSMEGLESWGKLSFAKAGFVYADVINTVSETYAKEIQTAEYGAGLDGLLRYRSQDLYGIVNGLDYEVWDPAKDPKLPRRYSRATLTLKVDNKLSLQKNVKLPAMPDIPLIGVVSRLDVQKGFDLLVEIMDDIVKLNCQFLLLGTGDAKFHQFFTALQKKNPKNISVNLGFDATLAELIYAGSDMFLMPSRYEPCGLGQLISFKFGTVPIVRKTGGLADTVKDYNAKSGQGDGFVFTDYTPAALLDAIKRAVDLYRNKKAAWLALQQRIMDYDYSWDASAKKYVGLYMKALGKVIK